MRRLAIAIALLLVVAAVPSAGGQPTARPAPGTAPVPDPVEDPPSVVTQPSAAPTPTNSSRILPIGQDATTGYTAPGVSLPTSLESQYRVLEGRFDEYTAASEIRNAPTASAALERYGVAIVRAANRTERLEDRWRRVRTGLANGSVAPGTASRRVGAIATAAAAQRRSLVALRGLIVRGNASTVAPAESERLQNRSAGLVTALDAMSGPVSQRLAAAGQGTAPSRHVYVASNGHGFVVATVDDGTYYREATRLDNADGADPDALDLLEGRNLTAEAYPTTWAAAAAGTRRVERAPPGAYQAVLEYPGGTLSAFLDATTGGVYREIQTINLSSYDAPPGRERRQSGLVLRVNRTFAGGPLRVTLTDESGEPVDGRVTVEGNFVGTTGTDGVLWTVSPGGRGDDLVILTAEHEGTQIPLTYELTGEG